MRISRTLFPGAVLLVAILLVAAPGPALGRILSAGAGGFPFPPGLKENVEFWRDVFTRYKFSEVIFHDEYHLGRRYGVFHLGEPWKATREQKKRLRAHKDKIRAILLALAEGRAASAGTAALTARIRNMFSGLPRRELRAAAYQVRGQPGLRERFLEGYIRSGRYLAHFRRIFRKHGLPEELTLLPHVESGFRSAIYSHAGALGLWQFTRGTGRLFMRVDGTVDARRDPFLSAKAAARLLKRNFEDLKSWPLAITAYNHGALGMRRAAKQVGSRRIDLIVRHYKSRTFGFASRNFYAEFLAAVQVHNNAEKYFGAVRLDPPRFFDEFHVPGFIRMKELTRRIGMDARILRKLNPALRPPVTRGWRSVPRGYPLRLPLGEGARVRKAYYQGVEGSPSADGGDGSKWVLVRPGDSLGRIARRHRVRLGNLMKENGLEKTLIRVGDRLRLPERASTQKQTAARKPAAARPKLASRQVKNKKTGPRVARLPGPRGTQQRRTPHPSKPQKSPIARKSIPPAPPAKKSPQRVASAPQTGERSLFRFISEYDLPETVPSRGSRFREGALRQSLVVSPSSGGKKAGWVRVQENETIGHISRWLLVSPGRLRRMNGIRSSRRVRMGKKIRVSFLRVPKEDFIERRIAYHKGIEKTFFNKYTVSRVKRHKLKPGENIWTLLVRTYRVPLWLVRHYNGNKDLRRITAGDEVAIPVVERRKF